MDEFTPHYDADGAFVGVTLYVTKYSAGHPIADLWLNHDRLRRGLDAIASGQIFTPISFATAVFDGRSVAEATQIDLDREFGL